MAITFSDALETGLEYEYRWRIAKLFERIDFLGVSHWRDDPSLPLTQLYVPLSLMTEQGHDETAQRLSVGDALEQSRHLVVLGDPGAGKSTLIKLLAYSFAAPEPTPLNHRFGPLLPIPIILKDYDVRSWSSRKDMLRDFIAFTVPSQIREQITVEWLEEALLQGKAILLIDGLDEVGDKKTRENLRNNILLPLHGYASPSRIVSTSRIIGYGEVPIDKHLGLYDIEGELFEIRHQAGLFYVAPFDETAIDEFALRWYTLREPHEAEREQKIAAFRNAIRKNKGTLKLASNPRLLMMMALIFLKGADLPSGRVKLYDRIVETYLITLQDYKGIGRFAAELEEMKKWLAAVGRYLQERRSEKSENELQPEILISHSQLLATITEAIREDRPNSNAEEEAKLFLEYAMYKGGLLLPRGQHNGEELYAFIHLTFQEYFAAFSIRTEFWDFQKLFSEFDTLVNTVKFRAKDSRWHETLVLLFEMLSEMRGLADRVSDSLIDNINSNSAEKILLCHLIEDSESGISTQKRFTLLESIIECMINDFDLSLLLVLLDISEIYKDFISNWFKARFSLPPNELPLSLLPFAAELIGSSTEEWQEFLFSYFSKHINSEWSDFQINNLIFWLGHHQEILSWANPYRFSILNWLKNYTIGWRYISVSDFYLDNISINDLVSPLIRILTLINSISKTNIFRSRALRFSESLLTVSWSIHTPKLPKTFTSFEKSAPVPLINIHPSRAKDYIWDIYKNNEQFKSLYLSSSNLPPYIDPSGDRFIDVLIESRWLFGHPKSEERYSFTINLLNKYSSVENDDFTRLCAITALGMLGITSKETISIRNNLLDKAMDSSSEFSFPQSIKAESDKFLDPKQRKIIFQHIWFHEKGTPWPKTEWLNQTQVNNPEHEAYWFCSSPEKLFPRLAIYWTNEREKEEAKELLKRCEELGLTP